MLSYFASNLQLHASNRLTTCALTWPCVLPLIRSQLCAKGRYNLLPHLASRCSCIKIDSPISAMHRRNETFQSMSSVSVRSIIPPAADPLILIITTSSRKQRCEFKDESRTACHYCESRSLECSFSREPWRVGWSGPPESPITVSSSATAPESVQKSASSSAESGMPPQEVCEDLIQVYFSTMHNTHHALFHRPTFMKDFNEGNIPQVILLSIFALIAR